MGSKIQTLGVLEYLLLTFESRLIQNNQRTLFFQCVKFHLYEHIQTTDPEQEHVVSCSLTYMLCDTCLSNKTDELVSATPLDQYFELFWV